MPDDHWFLTRFISVIALSASIFSPPALADENPDWQGIYIGALLGGGKGNVDGLGALAGANASDDLNGVFGGVIAGWNFQIENIIFGIEADASISGVSGDINILGVAVNENIDWSTNLRARMGYLAAPNILAYAAGGLAIARFDVNTNSPVAGNDSDIFTGWTIGGGIEAGLTENLKARFEYLYSDYGTQNMFASVGGVNVSPQVQSVRAAIVANF